MLFLDRADAGRRLAERLRPFASSAPIVLGLPRGGVPVAYEVALALRAPLDVLVVRKLGVPFQRELAMGAIGEDGIRVLNTDVVQDIHASADLLAAEERRERAELDHLCRRLRGERPALPIAGRTVLVIDDGIATGATARAACRVARARGALRVVLAVPVAPARSTAELAHDADEVICLQEPSRFHAVGQFYIDFRQVSDADVALMLARAGAVRLAATADGADDPPPRERRVEVPADGVVLSGTLTSPDRPLGLVLFAHGSGSSQHSPRNRSVAAALNSAGLATLLFDLLTPAEESDRRNVFDLDLLAARMRAATGWVRRQPDLEKLPLGYFGASTGAAAALTAAAAPDAPVAAVVSRGGRPDLALADLGAVRAPTLLIVGGLDHEVLRLNRRALAALRCPSRLEVVPGATHLFEEPGALAIVARLAIAWFTEQMGSSSAEARVRPGVAEIDVHATGYAERRR